MAPFKYLFTVSILIIFLFFTCCQSSDETKSSIEIQIDNWQFRQAGTENWMPATVPGTVHTDLLNQGKIEDPFYRINEKDQQWIDKNDWEYQGKFQADADFIKNNQIEIAFDGLDTYADVYVNGEKVLSTENMFVRYTADIKPYINEGENIINVYFHSPINRGLELLDAHGYNLPATNDQSENGELGDKKVSVFTRKAGYHYGWDWGPRFVTSGIWRPVVVKGWRHAKLRDVFFKQIELTNSSAKLNAIAEVEVFEATEGEFEVYLQEKKLTSVKVKLKAGLNTINADFEIENPKLWWSHGLGEAYLYELEGKLHTSTGSNESVKSNVGLRTLKLVQEPDSIGKSFHFELNGVPVFAKGANYIPNDNFLPRVSASEYEKVIMSAKDANMNMLRVWGGGIYENKTFYDLCDRNGIMVWQDFMLACSMYPGDKAFLQNVKLEAIDNVKRLRQHPSIVLWCGNNEMDWAWANHDENQGWGWKQQYNASQRTEIWKAYEDIFHSILPEAVQEYDPDRYYWPSSPMAELTGGPDQHANDFTRGDIHYWGVWHGLEPFSNFKKRVGRFMSEYGFQSFPEFNTVKKYTVPEDWDIESEVMASHQRSGIGNLRIKEYMSWDYQTPADFEHFLYVGQVLQAEGMKAAFEAHRRAMPYCMGTLYWQINDCWPVASWSSTDYHRNWKAMHYFAKNAFKEVLVSMDLEADKVDVFVISDRLESFNSVLKIQLLSFDGQVYFEEELPIKVPANTSSKHFSINLAELIGDANPRNVVLVASVSESGSLLSESHWYANKPKDLELPKVEIKRKVSAVDGVVSVELSTDNLAKNVFLSIPDETAHFSDNYFDLMPGQSKNITIKTDKSAKEIQNALQVISLVDTY